MSISTDKKQSSISRNALSWSGKWRKWRWKRIKSRSKWLRLGRWRRMCSMQKCRCRQGLWWANQKKSNFTKLRWKSQMLLNKNNYCNLKSTRCLKSKHRCADKTSHFRHRSLTYRDKSKSSVRKSKKKRREKCQRRRSQEEPLWSHRTMRVSSMEVIHSSKHHKLEKK